MVGCVVSSLSLTVVELYNSYLGSLVHPSQYGGSTCPKLWQLYRAPDPAEVSTSPQHLWCTRYPSSHPGAQVDLSSWPARKRSRPHLKHTRASPHAKAPGAQAQPPSGAVALPATRRENGLIGRTSGRPARRAGGASLAARSTMARRKGVSCVACTGRNVSSQARRPKP